MVAVSVPDGALSLDFLDLLNGLGLRGLFDRFGLLHLFLLLLSFGGDLKLLLLGLLIDLLVVGCGLLRALLSVS